MFNATMRFLSDDYDKIMSDIKRKINVYLTLAIGRAHFLINHDENTQGYIEQTMKFLIEEFGDSDSDMTLPYDAGGLFNIFTQGYIDRKSLSFPKSRRAIERADASEDVHLSDEEIQQAREEQLKEAYNPYSKDLMKKYVLKLMGNNRELFARDIPVKQRSDVLTVISSAAYALENGFDIEIEDGYIENGGYVIRDFVIRRKRA